MSETITVAGALAQRPGRGGHAWVFLQYLLGFRRLGYDVLFVDQATEGASVDYLRGVMDEFGIEWALLPDAGVPRAEVLERVRRSAVLLNVMGYLDDGEILAAAPLRVFLDIDPGFGQMWRELGLADIFAGHDRYVTVGTRVGQPDCGVPTCGLDWIPTLPPVELSRWPLTPGRPGRFTSIASWRGPFGPIDYQGHTYGLRVHEQRRFAELPERVDAEFELALDIDPADAADAELLRRHGWQLVDPAAAVAAPSSYGDYIRGSSAELTVAKNMYVATRGGWFSDRSACYLASGRPVLAQETGVSELLPRGAGFLTFTSLEEAAELAARIDTDYARHSRAARELAEEHLAAERVLGRILAEVT